MSSECSEASFRTFWLFHGLLGAGKILFSTRLDAKLGLRPGGLGFSSRGLMSSECPEASSPAFWLSHWLLGLEKCCSAPV